MDGEALSDLLARVEAILPSAFLKEWWGDDGSRRLRVDLHPRLDRWMPADTKVTPLYSAEPLNALIAESATAVPVNGPSSPREEK